MGGLCEEQFSMNKHLKVAFVTGGHRYEVPPMQQALRSIPGMDIFSMCMTDWVEGDRTQYDVVVFFSMMRGTPTDNDKKTDAKVFKAMEELGTTPMGIFVLHHAILSHQDWPMWNELVGMTDRKWVAPSPKNVPLRARNVAPDHPLTRGMADWDLVDEIYVMADAKPEDGNTIVMTTDEPQSMKTLGWTRQFRQSRVFCYQSGHDGVVYKNPGFRDVLERGIRWVAPSTQSLQLPSTAPAVFFVGEGKSELRDIPTPACKAGHILCQAMYTGVTNGTERRALLSGHKNGKPRQPGYQAVARVLEVGAGVVGYAPGDVVFCGEHGCGHKQYVLIEAMDPERLMVKLPPEIDPKQAAVLAMASISLHDVRRADVRLGEKVLIVGAGPVGQFAAQAARACGAIVTVVDIDEPRLQIARSCGAHHTIRVEAGGSWDQVRASAPFDVVLETSGAPILEEVFKVLPEKNDPRGKGRIVLVALRDRIEYNHMSGHRCEAAILHCSHLKRDDLEQTCRLVAEGVILLAPVVKDVIPYDQAPAFFDRLRDNPASTFGTVIDWTSAS